MAMEAHKCPLFGLESRGMSLLAGIWAHGRRLRMCKRTRAWHFLYWAPAKILWASRNISSYTVTHGLPRAVQRRSCSVWPKFISDQMWTFLQNQSAAGPVTLRALSPGDSGESALGTLRNDE